MSKSARWAWLVSSVAVLGTALVLAFVLSLSTTGLISERHFIWLFWLNAAVASLLLLVILLAALRLATRLRSGKFGSRLLLKLAGVFALVAVLPGSLIYGVSYQFVARTIDTWFDEQVAGALDAGLALGRGTLDAAASELASQARSAAERLADSRSTQDPLALERLRNQLGVRDVALLGANGQVLASVGGNAEALLPERPAQSLLRQARSQRSVGTVEGLDDEPRAGSRPQARVRALALVPNLDISLAAPREERFLMLVQPVPDTLVANALAVQAAYREYQQRAISRDSLRRMVLGTLTLALVLSVFGALLLAVLLANQIVRPLLLVAEGVRQVAEGDLTAKPVFASQDELGGLTRDFAQMTEQLSDARAQVQRGVAQLEGARTRLQTILDSLTAGVIVFDHQRRIDTVNPGRHAHPAPAAVGLLRPRPGRGARPGRSGRRSVAAQRTAPVQPRTRRTRPLAGRLRARHRRPVQHQPAAARRGAARRRATAGVRRHHRNGLGPAFGGLGRGGAPAGA